MNNLKTSILLLLLFIGADILLHSEDSITIGGHTSYYCLSRYSSKLNEEIVYSNTVELLASDYNFGKYFIHFLDNDSNSFKFTKTIVRNESFVFLKSIVQNNYGFSRLIGFEDRYVFGKAYSQIEDTNLDHFIYSKRLDTNYIFTFMKIMFQRNYVFSRMIGIEDTYIFGKYYPQILDTDLDYFVYKKRIPDNKKFNFLKNFYQSNYVFSRMIDVDESFHFVKAIPQSLSALRLVAIENGHFNNSNGVIYSLVISFKNITGKSIDRCVLEQRLPESIKLIEVPQNSMFDQDSRKMVTEINNQILPGETISITYDVLYSPR